MPSPAPAVVDPRAVLQFERYEAEGWGIAAPIGSGAQRDGNAVILTSDHPVLQGGTLEITVIELGERDGDPPEILAAVPVARAVGPSVPYTMDEFDFGSIAAARSYPVAPTFHCAELHVVEGLATTDGGAFLIRIAPDAAGRCDARALGDTSPILESFSVRGR